MTTMNMSKQSVFHDERIVMATLLMDLNGKKHCPKTFWPHTCAMATALAPWRREHPAYRSNAEVLRNHAEPTP